MRKLVEHAVESFTDNLVDRISPEDAPEMTNQVNPQIKTGDHSRVEIDVHIGDKASSIEDPDPESRAGDIDDDICDPGDR